MPDILFKWPVSVPSGHQSIHTETGNIRKNVKSALLIKENGDKIDLFASSGIDEIERLTLICAAVGVYGGIRYDLSSGYVVAACINAPACLKPESPDAPTATSIKTGGYAKARIELRYEKIIRTCSVETLMNAAFILGSVLDESESKEISVTEKKVEDKQTVVPRSLDAVNRLYKS